MLIRDIIGCIESVAPPAAAASWDCSGLQVASARSEAEVLGVCLDPSPDSIRACLEAGAQCILSHHPLALGARLPARMDAYRETLRLLLGADVPLYAAHTSLDANQQGPAGWLGRELGLACAKVLEITHRMPDGRVFGFGQAGILSAPMSLEVLATFLSRHISLDHARLCGPRAASIRSLAYCPGSGSSLIAAARDAGAEIFISGDIRYHSALDAEICVLDVGHHSLEEEMMRRFSQDLAASIAPCRVVFVASRSPFYSIPPMEVPDAGCGLS